MDKESRGGLRAPKPSRAPSPSPSCGGTAPGGHGARLAAGCRWGGCGRLQRQRKAEARLRLAGGRRQQTAAGQREGEEACNPPLPAASPAADVSWCLWLPRCQVRRQTLPTRAQPRGHGRGLAGGGNPIPTQGPHGAPWGHSPSAGPPLTRPVLLPKAFGLLMAGGGGRKNIQQTIAKVKSEQEGGCVRGDAKSGGIPWRR